MDLRWNDPRFAHVKPVLLPDVPLTVCGRESFASPEMSRLQVPISSFLDSESIEIGKDRIHVLVGKVDLRHRPVSFEVADKHKRSPAIRLRARWAEHGI